MTNNTETTQRKAAKIAGISLLLMALVAGFSYGFVLNSLIVPEDSAATFVHLKSSESLFRFGVFGWVVILILDVLVAWSIYIFFKELNKGISLLTAWLRMVYACILAIAIANLVIVMVLIGNSENLTSFDSEQLHELIMVFLNGFTVVWSIALIVFGLHLLGLASLILQSISIPKVFGILMIVAGVGYVLIPIAKLVFPQFQDQIATIEVIMGVPMAIAELSFAFWLIIKGGKMEMK